MASDDDASAAAGASSFDVAKELMPAEQVQHYLDRALDFGRGMQMLRDEKSYMNSATLLAIHSAISYADALRVGLGDVRLTSEDHRFAAETLRSLLSERRFDDRSGLNHLRELISWKSSVSYGDDNLADRDHALLATKAERFAVWANRTGTSLQIEGWRHEDL